MSDAFRTAGTLEEEARRADLALRGAMRWAGIDWGSPDSLAWAANGAANRITRLEAELQALREVEQAAREMFPYLGTDDDAIRPGKRRPLFDALAAIDKLRGGG